MALFWVSSLHRPTCIIGHINIGVFLMSWLLFSILSFIGITKIGPFKQYRKVLHSCYGYDSTRR
jgi:hypothetical protein